MLAASKAHWQRGQSSGLHAAPFVVVSVMRLQFTYDTHTASASIVALARYSGFFLLQIFKNFGFEAQKNERLNEMFLFKN